MNEGWIGMGLLSVHLDGPWTVTKCLTDGLRDVARFNLTHVVVFSMLIGLLCMLHHPAQAASIMGEALGWNENPILDAHTYLMCYI